jgi:hypothetical protein
VYFINRFWCRVKPNVPTRHKLHKTTTKTEQRKKEKTTTTTTQKTNKKERQTDGATIFKYIRRTSPNTHTHIMDINNKNNQHKNSQHHGCNIRIVGGRFSIFCDVMAGTGGV